MLKSCKNGANLQCYYSIQQEEIIKINVNMKANHLFHSLLCYNCVDKMTSLIFNLKSDFTKHLMTELYHTHLSHGVSVYLEFFALV